MSCVAVGLFVSDGTGLRVGAGCVSVEVGQGVRVGSGVFVIGMVAVGQPAVAWAMVSDFKGMNQVSPTREETSTQPNTSVVKTILILCFITL